MTQHNARPPVPAYQQPEQPENQKPASGAGTSGQAATDKGSVDHAKSATGKFDEHEFLPAALEILETPASPVGRAVIISLAVFTVILLVWSFLGTVDIVAVASGRIVPRGGVSVVQPLEPGIVRAIHVRDGQHVSKGALLIELDPTEIEADEQQLLRQRIESSTAVERLSTYLDHLQGSEHVTFQPPDLGSKATNVVEMHRLKLKAELQAYQSQLSAFDAEIASAEAVRNGARAEKTKLEILTPLLEEREQGMRGLWEDGFSSKTEWLVAHTSLVTTVQDKEVQEHRLAQAEADVTAARRKKERFTSESIRLATTDLSAALLKLEQTLTAIRRVKKQVDRLRLRAPVDGIVQQLEVHTIGGVVTTAEPLLTIVPDDAVLEVRASILNKDKGFVHDGQHAALKIEAFPFTKYGLVDGEVLHVSGDAVIDEQQGLTFDTRVAMFQDYVFVDGAPVKLTPGMAVTAEIKTGSRRVIEFLLAPLLRYKDESLKER